MKTSHGNKIYFLRKKYNIQQVDLAKEIGLDRACLSLIENGKRKLNLDECISICLFFKISLDEFIGNIKSHWVDISSGLMPNDDETVLVKNIKVKMLPIKAYYETESNQFFSLESIALCPLNITHYMYIPD